MRNYCLNAEIIIPISSEKSKAINVKVVENTFDTTDEIHIMTSFMMLKSNKDLWTIKGTTSTDGGSFEEWDNTGAYFAFEDSSYDPIKGEITGFTPTALKSMMPNEGDIKSKFKNVYFKPVYQDHYFVRFYVPNSLRDTAEKLLNIKLPDEFCESKYTGDILTLAVEHIDFSGLSKEAIEIIQKPIIISPVNYKDEIKYQGDIRATESSIYPVNSENSKKAKVPEGYPMRRVGGAKVNTIDVHPDVQERLQNALKDVLKHYGAENMEKLIPSACIFSCGVRPRSESGMHERGFAIDLHASQNQPFHVSATARQNTTFEDPIYRPFLAIMLYHGWRNLGHDGHVYSKGGKYYGDWMHFQAAIGSYAKALRCKTLKNIRKE